MKYRGIKIRASLPNNAFEPFEAWSEIAGYLQNRGYLKNEYHLSLGLKKRSPSDLGTIEVKKVGEIEACLKNNEGSPVLRAVHKIAGSFLYDQSVTYFANKGELIIFADEGHIPPDWDDFLITSKIGKLVTNVIQTDQEYLSEHGKNHSPPNNNLFQFPALSNLRENYLQGVSAEMWLGETFWQHAACTKEQFLAQDWLKCDIRQHHIHVEAYHQPFTAAEGEQGEIQRRLLKLLFDIDENNPTGTAHLKTPPPPPKTFTQKVEIDQQGNITAKGLTQSPPPTKPDKNKKRWWKR